MENIDIKGEKLSEDIHSKKNNIPYYSLSLYEKMTPIMNFAFADPSFIELRNKKIIDSINTLLPVESKQNNR